MSWIESTIGAMSPEQKVGQLFVPYVTGATANTPSEENTARFGVATPAEAIEKFHLGGVIYFAWSENTNDPQQIAALSNGLQRANAAAGNPVPLWISTDQETGSGGRVGPPATVFPEAMALAASRDPEATRRAYAITGAELRAMGITLDFAPVADVNVNPANPVIGTRSFGSDPSLVADHVVAAVDGLQDSGVSACAKHFPGHGDTDQDSHAYLPTITHTRQQWEKIDAPPFRAAIAAGVDMIMTAHLSFPALEPSGDPCTLSRAVLTDLLRGQLGFEGVIVTDSLRMEGVRTRYADVEVPVRAIEAGADVLLDPPQPERQIRAVIDALRSGRLTEQRIEESVRRILIMKRNRGVLARPYADESAIATTVGTAAHLRDAQQITDRTTTVVTDLSRLVPLPPGSVLVTGWGATQVAQLATGLAERGWNVTSSVTEARRHDLIIVTTSSAWKDPGQRELVAELRATGKPVLVVALGDPYDIAYLEGIDAYLATYSSTSVAVESALRVITGAVTAAGGLPVDIGDQ